MKNVKYIVLLLGIMCGISSCQKDEDITMAVMTVKNELIEPSYTSATIECFVECNVRFDKVVVEYALTEDFAEPMSAVMTDKEGLYHIQCQNLLDDTTYYVRYTISNRISSLRYDRISTFRTLEPSIPTVHLDSVVNIWDVKAEAIVHVEFDGGTPITELGVSIWGNETSDTLQVKTTTQDQTQLSLQSLQSNTTYSVRAYAKNKMGIAYSEHISFVTLALPEVKTNDITDIQLTSSILSGTLLFDGNDTATIKGFCWSEKSEPTIEDTHIHIDTVANEFSYCLSKLKDETQYYVRAYAKNKIGIVYGEERSFTTQSAVIPTVSTSQVSNVDYHTATVGGNVSSDGGAEVTERGICYSTTATPTIESTKVVYGKGIGSYAVNLSNLQDSTTYYVRAYAINKKGIAYGEQVAFMTKGYKLPTITTATPTNVEYTSATVGGNVSSDGGAEVTERGICYSTTATPTIESTKVVYGKGTGSFTINLTSLTDSTTYYVRAYAINRKGISYGEQVSFMTKVYSTPIVTTTIATQVGTTSAVVGGNVTFDGGKEVTEYGICYSTTYNPTIEGTKIIIGNGTGEFTYELWNIIDNTTYYVRAYAINAKGVGYGETISFTTKEKTFVDGYEYVDLGLPSGLKWATHNIGATKPEEFGDYFAWGETEPRSQFDFNNKYITFENDSLRYGKYTTKYYHNLNVTRIIDNKVTLELMDDAAYVQWGGKWRMPTYNELLELKNKCQWNFVKCNEVEGYNVVGPNGKSIFLPISMWYGFSGNVYTHGGNILSSSLCWNDNYWIEALYYASNGVYAGIYKGNTAIYRFDGLTVRPVYGEWQTEVLPEMEIQEVSEISNNSAIIRGYITGEGSAEIIEYGICYDNSPNSSRDNKIVLGSGIGNIDIELTGLEEGTNYYVRIYAQTENRGILYTNEISFMTKSNKPYFSVGDDKQVVFSPGNLQYTQSTNTWSFASAQYEVLGTDNVTGGSVSSDATYGDSKSGSALADKVDLFGWSTSATNFGVSTSTDYDDYYGSFVDWGTNQIGEDVPNTWRTLSEDEWYYLRYTRTNADNLVGVAQVNGVNGLIFLPDNWTCPEGVTFKSGFHSSYGVDYYAAYQTFTAEQWSKLEAAGAIFLPAAGNRYGTNVFDVQDYGYYWSATGYSSEYARYLGFRSDKARMSYYNRCGGRGVRLVKDL